MFYLAACIVQGKAGARRGRYSEPGVQRHRAVVAGANRDAVAVEQLSQVMGMRVLDGESYNRALLVERRRTQDAEAVKPTQKIVGVLQQGALVCIDLVVR